MLRRRSFGAHICADTSIPTSDAASHLSAGHKARTLGDDGHDGSLDKVVASGMAIGGNHPRKKGQVCRRVGDCGVEQRENWHEKYTMCRVHEQARHGM